MKQRKLSFAEAFKLAITTNYCKFEGRASRSEYWWFVLGSTILYFLIALVLSFNDMLYSIVLSLANLALFLPGLGLAIRRLHDINKSGWWILLAFIPLIGSIILLVWFCKESTPAANEYGEIPNLEQEQ